MKYIKKVILENFQSHKYSEVEFDSQLNIIVGASDSGKTAILRGIKWVLYNEPRGDFFIRQGSTECRVSLILNNGVKVSRHRSKSKNSYILTEIDGEEKVFEGFGHNIPYEVIEATGIKSIHLDQDKTRSVNLAEQLDGAFLLSESGSVKASSIGRLIGANIIDDALRESLSDSRRLSSTKNSIYEDINHLEKEAKTFNYLIELEKKIDMLKIIKDKIDFIEDRLETITDLKSMYNYIGERKINFNKIIDKTNKLEKLSIIINRIELSYGKYNQLTMKNEQLKSVKEGITSNKSVLLKMEGLNKSNNIYIDLINLTNKLNILNSLKVKNDKNNYEKTLTKKYIFKMKDLSNLSEHIYDIEENLDLYNKLYKLNQNFKDIENRLNIGREYTRKFQDINSVSKIIDDINLKIKIVNKLKKYNLSYNQNLEVKEKLTKNYIENKNNIDIMIKEYESILKKQEICPFCFSVIDDKTVDRILENYREEY